MTRYGRVGGPPCWINGKLEGMDPLILLTPDIVGACFADGGLRIGGIVGCVDRAGFLTLACPDGVWKYELHPARFSDGNGPALYLGVWPD